MLKKLLTNIWVNMSVLNDKLFYHGADFGRWMTNSELGIDDSHGNPYAPTLPWNYQKALRKMSISDQDSCLDIGCGKGRAMYIISQYGFKRVDGYDLSEELVKIANDNLRLLKVEDRCHAMVADAETYERYDDYNYLFLGNSVPMEVFKSMMKHVEESIVRKPRKVTLLYQNPEERDHLEKNTSFSLKKVYKSWLSPINTTWFDLYIYTND